MQLSFFEMVKKGVSTIIEVVDAFARTELVRLENLINGLATVARTGSYNDLTDKPTIPVVPDISQVGLTGEYDDLLNKPTLFSGNYNDLINKPTIPTNTSQLNNDSDFITSQSLPVFNDDGTFCKIRLNPNTVVCVCYGTNYANYDLTSPYASGYIADFAITIPENCRPTTGWSAIDAHAIKTGAIISAHVTGYSNGVVTGYLYSPSSGVSGSVGVSIEMFGY